MATPLPNQQITATGFIVEVAAPRRSADKQAQAAQVSAALTPQMPLTNGPRAELHRFMLNAAAVNSGVHTTTRRLYQFQGEHMSLVAAGAPDSDEE
jgi:hypothetical protein